ncbi:hypothetical protein [Desulfofalx alkaliphila]|uniref:hypothetical protein n=1 Tax=Desulfofalx alkaliphila TaxID=105483 RepID=UPI000B2A2CF6|nr:hypothetical protein [Desulfofalx alkaliphila]
MWEKIKKFFFDERGTFLEQLLWMALFVLLVAPFIYTLGNAVGNKFDSFTDKVNEVGG